LAFGLGTVIPTLKYNDFVIWNFPIGLVFLVLAVAIAHYWVIRREDAETKTTTTVFDPATGTIKIVIEEGKTTTSSSRGISDR